MRLTWRIWHWMTAALAIVGFVPAAAAADFGQAVSSPWVPATALSLTLVTAVIKSQK
jgi:hypothetical protein